MITMDRLAVFMSLFVGQTSPRNDLLLDGLELCHLIDRDMQILVKGRDLVLENKH